MLMLWRTWCLLVVLGVVFAQRIDQDAILSPRPARVRDREMAKQDEPTCDQLKAMWRFSKRQARAPEIMNEVSSYRDPLMYNEWPAYSAMPRAAPRFRYQYPSVPHEAYGRVVTKAPPNVVRTPDYDEVRSPKKLIRQEHVRELQRKYETEQKQGLKEIAAGRGNEDYAYGKYGEMEPRGLQPLPMEYPSDDPTTRHAKFRYQYPSVPHEAYGRVVTKAPPNVVRTPDYDEVRSPKKLIRQEHVRELQRKYETEQKQGLKEIAAGRGNEDYAYGKYGEMEPRGLQPLPMEYPSDDQTTRHAKKPPSGSRQVSQFPRYSDVMLPPVRRTFYHPYFDYPTPEFVPYVY